MKSKEKKNSGRALVRSGILSSRNGRGTLKLKNRKDVIQYIAYTLNRFEKKKITVEEARTVTVMCKTLFNMMKEINEYNVEPVQEVTFSNGWIEHQDIWNVTT